VLLQNSSCSFGPGCTPSSFSRFRSSSQTKPKRTKMWSHGFASGAAAAFLLLSAGQTYAFSLGAPAVQQMGSFLAGGLPSNSCSHVVKQLPPAAAKRSASYGSSAVRCMAVASGPAGGFDTRDFIAVQLIGHFLREGVSLSLYLCAGVAVRSCCCTQHV